MATSARVNVVKSHKLLSTARPAPKAASVRRSSKFSSIKMRAGADAGPFDGYSFKPIKEREVSREMTTRYFKDLYKYADADVIIVGSGSAGLACAYELSKHPDVSVAVSDYDSFTLQASFFVFFLSLSVSPPHTHTHQFFPFARFFDIGKNADFFFSLFSFLFCSPLILISISVD